MSAEGAISKEDSRLAKKEYRKKREKSQFSSVSYELADEITKRTGREVRVTSPGHAQRGGNPDSYDRVLSTRLGAQAGMLILEEKYGYMVGYMNNEIVKIPLEEIAGKLKSVPIDDQIIKEVKALGICMGN